MRRLIAMLLACSVTLGLLAEEHRFSANDSRVTYVGRNIVSDGSVSFDWTGVYVRVAFEGNVLRMRCSDSGADYFNLWLDRPMAGDADRVIRLSGDTVVTLVELTKAKPGQHQIILQKRTEGEQGRLTIHELITEGELLPAMPLKPRQLEFIGDSYTCGFGAEESLINDPFTPETESATQSYASVLARTFDADYVMIAHSGMGVCRNYNSKVPGYYMPERYLQTLDMVRDSLLWDVHQDDFQPDMTIIFLGANDFSVNVTPDYQQFRDQYILLLNRIRANYGAEHPILCCSKQHYEVLQQYVRQMLAESQMKGVYFVPCQSGLFPDDEWHLGACGHPSALTHRKIACMLTPYVSSILGWNMPTELAK